MGDFDLNRIISILLITLATVAVFLSMSSSLPSSEPVGGDAGGKSDTHLKYTTITGYFLQDDPATDPGTFDAMNQNFGLINRDYDTDLFLPDSGRGMKQWERFALKVGRLNSEAENEGKGTRYKLLYLGRHGQGFHNVGEEFYGTGAWNCYYSALDHDTKAPEVVFQDAHLTKLGMSQARNLSGFWGRLLAEEGAPAPERYYTSPLSRAVQTSNITFGPLRDVLPSLTPYRPIVKELLREGHGIHTCDQRPSKTYLEKTYDNIIFLARDTFSEKDALYSPKLREPPAAFVKRMTMLLDDVFDTDESTYISMTSHSGTISTILRAIGHRPFSLPTGGAIPVLVKAEVVSGRREPFDLYDKTGWETKPDCEDDPLMAGKRGFKDIGEYVRYIEAGAES